MDTNFNDFTAYPTYLSPNPSSGTSQAGASSGLEGLAIQANSPADIPRVANGEPAGDSAEHHAKYYAGGHIGVQKSGGGDGRGTDYPNGGYPGGTGSHTPSDSTDHHDQNQTNQANSQYPSTKLPIPTRILNTGALCPGIGYGTGGEGKATPEELYEALRAAIKVGYRCFDSAPFYQDGLVEKILGQAIRDSGISRKSFFITTKVWPTYHRFPQESVKLSLDNLQLGYIDCLLMHWPIPLRPVPGEPYAMGDTWDAGWDFKRTWGKMQEISKSEVRAIGVCNFTVNRLRLLMQSPSTKVPPAILQVEGHPELPQKALMQFCRQHRIQVFCFSPLAQGQVSNTIIGQVASKHGVGAGQVAISWAVMRGTVPVPKSVNFKRIQDNIDLVVLDEEDMEVLDTLGKYPRRIVNPRILFGHDIFENNADSYDLEEQATEADGSREHTKRRRG